MTTPTQAQIEAVIKAIADIDHYDGEGHGLCMTGYEEIARAVLTAAAQVGRRLTDDELMDAEADMITRTIERCARVADNFNSDTVDSREIAAAIRRLKDEP